MGNPYWPLFDLALQTTRLVLRPCTEADITHLAALLPSDVEMDPSLPPLGIADGDHDHRTKLLQFYWRSMGSWSHEHWRLNFVVLRSDVPIGTQELEATDFAGRGVVETSSWLVPEARRQGLGKEMRAAVLHLAFDGLGAVVAETEAWHDNEASLAVSDGLGYEPNGETMHRRGAGHDRMVRRRLTKARWELLAEAFPVIVRGLGECRHLLVAD
jgi:RimJ/RimL family protein N-acetyltransferase